MPCRSSRSSECSCGGDGPSPRTRCRRKRSVGRCVPAFATPRIRRRFAVCSTARRSSRSRLRRMQSLLPIVARNRLELSSSGGYGVLLGCFGVGAAAAAVIRPRLDERFHHDQLVVLVVRCWSLPRSSSRASAELPWATGVAMFIGGLAWATALTSTGVAAFSALPEWVRARGMGVYMLVLSGAYRPRQRRLGSAGRAQPHGRASRRSGVAAPLAWRPTGGGCSVRSPGSTCASSRPTIRPSRSCRIRPMGRYS